MKKIIFSLSIVGLLFISSCGGDDDSTPMAVGLSGTINYDGQSYSIVNGILGLSVEEGNAVGEFFMADGTITATSTGVSTSDSQIIISVVATSVGTATLGNGDYATSTDIPEKYADIQVTTSSGSKQAFTNGIVNISGSENTYTISFDVPFGQGIELTGTVSGTYAAR
ncbi:hypothetical protein [Ekhidna sp.]|uniref:hypothetical protein n=1 Tax=Ekhidna sp. TaxID=2608089 RepID=UPI003B512E72